MPAPLVYVSPGAVRGDRVTLAPGDIHHLRRVLRLRDGDAIVVGDGEGHHWRATLAVTEARLEPDPAFTPRLRPRIDVVHAVPKGGKFDDVVRVLVELGVDRIVPVVSERTVTRPRRGAERWRAVARAAAEQSRRAWLAEVDEPAPVAAVTPSLAPGVVAHPDAPPLRSVIGTLDGAEAVTIAVGPEGGWTDAELAAFERAGLRPAAVGDTVVRTEHAAVVVVAMVGYALGRFGDQPASPA